MDRTVDKQDTAGAGPAPDGPDLVQPNRISHPLRPGRWLAAGVTALVLVWFGWTIAVNPNLHWDIVVAYQFDRVILEGLWVTIQLTVASMLIGVVLGVVVALMQISSSRILRTGAMAYVWFFRGTPLLVQLIFWFNIALIFPEVGLGVPFGGPKLVTWETNALITGFVAALLGLSINEGAYMSEIVRAGLRAVDPGQQEAAAALGMSRSKIMQRVVLPQAMRIIVPPTGNQFISMLKTTSLVSVIAGADLLTVAQRLYLTNFEVIALLIVASIWYLVLTTVASVGQHYLERRFSRGFGTTASGTLRGRIGRNLRLTGSAR
ncbi:polar amino acid transport system permease protein [Micromonospora echinaurantiaca]|uniref:Polar amino acid transport system permease protein n=1 Tax=Micromonospora echinaurantiaca TaxID=47857 RepID=A0A1C5I3Z3_9ACTN|nr:amino acid ABC transporter permease [Micromonospora echinaurantiaca]SCG52913.1 polar amino acid transport system permease protein [Micromonospora echinaurantiaca]